MDSHYRVRVSFDSPLCFVLCADSAQAKVAGLGFSKYEVQIPSTKLRSTKYKAQVQSSKHKVHSWGTNFSTFNSRPSVVTVIVPHRPVISTSAPLTCQRSTTSLCGWPNIDVWPTEIIARLGRAARTNGSVDDVLLP